LNIRVDSPQHPEELPHDIKINISKGHDQTILLEGEKCANCPMTFKKLLSKFYACECGLTNLCRDCMTEHLRDVMKETGIAEMRSRERGKKAMATRLRRQLKKS
jgi:hypothetical protein